MRIVVGLLVMLAIILGLGFVLDLHTTAAASAEHASLSFATALLALVAAACGGGVARRAWFAPLAMAVYALLWAKAIYHLHRLLDRLLISATYPDLIVSNAVPIAVSLVAVGMGALLGYSLARARRPASAAQAARACDC